MTAHWGHQRRPGIHSLTFRPEVHQGASRAALPPETPGQGPSCPWWPPASLGRWPHGSQLGLHGPSSLGLSLLASLPVSLSWPLNVRPTGVTQDDLLISRPLTQSQMQDPSPRRSQSQVWALGRGHSFWRRRPAQDGQPVPRAELPSGSASCPFFLPSPSLPRGWLSVARLAWAEGRFGAGQINK